MPYPAVLFASLCVARLFHRFSFCHVSINLLPNSPFCIKKYHFIIYYSLDAHFTIRVPGSDSQQSQVYLCVADGVGSWRQHGVDPRQFSHRLHHIAPIVLTVVLLFDFTQMDTCIMSADDSIFAAAVFSIYQFQFQFPVCFSPHIFITTVVQYLTLHKLPNTQTCGECSEGRRG